MKGKRIISVVLCLLLTLSLLPVGALAEGEDPAAPALTSDPTDPQTDPEPGEDLEDPVADVDDEDPPADVDDDDPVTDVDDDDPPADVDDDDPVADLDDEDPPAPVEPQDDGPAAKDGDVYVVAGSANENLSQGGVPTPIFGTAWDGTLSANQMTLSGSVYTKTYTVAGAYTVEFKVVKNGETWYGNGESNIHLDLPAGCKFTVTFNPSTNAVSASVAMDYTSVYVASDLLNNWQADGQAMTQKQPGIWETQLQVPAGSHGFKFTIDGSWDRNFGRGLYQSTFVTGQERDAKWNGSDNMMLNFDAATTVTLRLNLTNFNYQTKSGAKYGVFVQDNTFNITLNATLDGVQGTPFYEGGGYNVADNTGVLRLLDPVDNMYRPKASAEGTLVRFSVTVPNGYSCAVTVTDDANNAITPTAGETTTDNLGRAVTEYSFGMSWRSSGWKRRT